MAAVAERLILRQPTTAEGDDLPPRQTKGCSFEILDLEVAFDANRPVPEYRNFRCCHRHLRW